MNNLVASQSNCNMNDLSAGQKISKYGNFKGTLWKSTKDIFPVHWKMCGFVRIENLLAPTFKIP